VRRVDVQTIGLLMLRRRGVQEEGLRALQQEIHRNTDSSLQLTTCTVMDLLKALLSNGSINTQQPNS
jgi:hypothetical protein